MIRSGENVALRNGGKDGKRIYGSESIYEAAESF